MKFAANLGLLFTELPLMQRPAAAVASGFSAIELSWPFRSPAPPAADVRELVAAVERTGVEIVLMNLFHSPEKLGLLSLPSEQSAFLANLDVALAIANELGIPRLHAPYGYRSADLDESEQTEVAVENLLRVAERAADVSVQIVVEPLNATDNPGYGLTSTTTALALIARVNRRAAHPIGLQCDLYHVAASGEDPVAILQRVAPWLRHVQIADYPGRAEPGTGTIDWPVVFETLQQIRYEGFVGLEYRPSGNVAATLGRLRTATRRPPENLK